MNRQQTRWLLVVIGVLLWILVVYPAYFVVHRPLSPANLQALANVAADLLTWLALLAVATALGSRLTRRLAYHSLLERLTFSAGLGLGCVSLVALGLGLVALLYPWLFWALLLGAGLLLQQELRNLLRMLRQVVLPRIHGLWTVFLSLFIALSLLLALTITLLPPYEWDSLTYHLVGPERYLKAHRLTFEFDNYYLFFPSFTEMLFTVGMALRGDVLPRLIHFTYLLLTLGAIGAFAARYWNRKLVLVAVALFLSIPTAIQTATWAYVDMALAFYSLAALYALLNWLPLAKPEEPDPQYRGPATAGWLILAGLCAGAAASIKYTGLTGMLVLIAVLLWTLIRRRLTLRRFLTATLVVTALTLAVAAPWYLKNALIAGNPIYPLVWGGQEWNEISTRWLLTLGQEMSLLDVLIIPWTLTVLGQQGTAAYDATFSPLFLTLLPLLLVVQRRGPGISELLLAAALGYAAWIASGATAYGTFVLQGRFALPVFAALSLLCAYSLHGLRIWDRKSFSIHGLMRLLVGLTLALGLLSQTLLTVGLNPLPYLIGHQSRAGYLDQHIAYRWHPAITHINENLAPKDKVLFIWEPRGYGCRVSCDADVLFDNFSQLLARYGSPEGVLAGLQREGVTHLLVNHFIYPWIVADYPLTPGEQANWEEFQARYLTGHAVVHAEGDYLTLYRLPQSTAP